MTNDKTRNPNGWVGARVAHGWTSWLRNALEGMANESGCLLGAKGSRQVPLSRRDILRIARRFNAGKHPAWHTSPEGTAEEAAAGQCLEQIVGFKRVHGNVWTTRSRLSMFRSSMMRDLGVIFSRGMPC